MNANPLAVGGKLPANQVPPPRRELNYTGGGHNFKESKMQEPNWWLIITLLAFTVGGLHSVFGWWFLAIIPVAILVQWISEKIN